MSYRVEVDAKFIFEGGQTFLEANGQRLDLSKLDSIDEWRVTCYAIATQAMADLAQVATAKQAPVASTSQAGQQLGAEFRQHQDRVLQQTKELQDRIVGQYNDLKNIHADTLASVTAQRATKDATRS